MPKVQTNYKNKFKKLPLKNNGTLQPKLDNYISYASERVDYFSNLNKFYFQINLTLMVAFSITFTFIFNIFENSSSSFINTILWGLGLYLCLTCINIWWNLSKNWTVFPEENQDYNIKKKIIIKLLLIQNILERKFKIFFPIFSSYNLIAKGLDKVKEKRKIRKNNELQEEKEKLDNEKFWKTLSFHKYNVPKPKLIGNKEIMEMYLFYFAKNFTNQKIEDNIDLENRFLRDDIKQLFMLYCYQSNYKFIAIRTRQITLWGIIIFIGSLILGLFFLGLTFV